MKITSSRKDEILKRKAQYDEDMKSYEERHRKSEIALRKAEDEILNPIAQYLERKLSRYSALKFEIQVNRAYSGRTGRGARVWIRCNDRNKFDDDVALAWSYDVDFNTDGEVTRKTSSWSGLSATTEEQMTSLRQTVSAIEFLNDVDWEELVDIDMPAYEDYYDPNDKKPEYHDFTAELKEAELEDIVGTNKIIKCKNWGESCPYRGDVWLKLNKETPSMYTANIIPNYIIEYAFANKDSYRDELQKYVDGRYGEYRVRKSSVRPITPIEIREV